MTIRTGIVEGLCRGSGNCALVGPEVFTLDNENRVALTRDTIPDSLADRIERAVRECPTHANDRVRVEVERVGVIENRFVAELNGRPNNGSVRCMR